MILLWPWSVGRIDPTGKFEKEFACRSQFLVSLSLAFVARINRDVSAVWEDARVVVVSVPTPPAFLAHFNKVFGLDF